MRLTRTSGQESSFARGLWSTAHVRSQAQQLFCRYWLVVSLLLLLVFLLHQAFFWHFTDLRHGKFTFNQYVEKRTTDMRNSHIDKSTPVSQRCADGVSFVQIPVNMARKPLSAIQRHLRGFVEFEGCRTPRIQQTTAISEEVWRECCRTWGTFAGHQYPRDRSGREYKPDPVLITNPVNSIAMSHRYLTSARCYKGANILLIVLYNHEFYQNTPFLRDLYVGGFGGIVFYGPKANATHNITGIHIHRGFFQHRAIAQAMADYPNYEGYLWIGDDVFLNYPVLLTRYASLHDKIWTIPPWTKADVFNESQYVDQMKDVRIGAMSIADSCVPKQYVQRMQCLCPYAMCVGKVVSDMGYVPSRFAERFIDMAYSFRNTFVELAIPTLLEMITDDVKTDIAILSNAVYLWGKNRLKPTVQFKIAMNQNVTLLHPFKLSSFSRRKEALLLHNISSSTFPCL